MSVHRTRGGGGEKSKTVSSTKETQKLASETSQKNIEGLALEIEKGTGYGWEVETRSEARRRLGDANGRTFI